MRAAVLGAVLALPLPAAAQPQEHHDTHETLVARGANRLQEREFDAAADDLRLALGLREQRSTRELLASSLFFAGRTAEALDTWNRIGLPIVGNVSVPRLVHTRRDIASTEVPIDPGEMLTSNKLRETRLRLEEVGIFDSIRVRPSVNAVGQADVVVGLVDRHGFGEWTEIAANLAVDIIKSRVRVKYTNVAGTGVSTGALYRWESARRAQEAWIRWPRPLGLGVNLRLAAFDGRQRYEVGETLDLKARGVAFDARRVLGGRTIATLGYRFSDRSVTVVRPDALPGIVSGIHTAVERNFAESRLHQLDASTWYFRTAGSLGSDVEFGQVVGSVRYLRFLAAREDSVLQKSVIGVQLVGGRGTTDTPIDSMFAPGAAGEMDYPLRGHKIRKSGVLGGAPLGRRLLLGNLEMRQRLVNRGSLKAGLVAFLDIARTSHMAQGGGTSSLADIGIGARISLKGSPLLRVDYGHSLSGDGKSALTVGFDQAF